MLTFMILACSVASVASTTMAPTVMPDCDAQALVLKHSSNGADLSACVALQTAYSQEGVCACMKNVPEVNATADFNCKYGGAVLLDAWRACHTAAPTVSTTAPTTTTMSPTTGAPTTAAPTENMETFSPTASPTASPSSAPTTKQPTSSPTTKQPTIAPTTKQPTAPTSAPETPLPICNKEDNYNALKPLLSSIGEFGNSDNCNPHLGVLSALAMNPPLFKYAEWQFDACPCMDDLTDETKTLVRSNLVCKVECCAEGCGNCPVGTLPDESDPDQGTIDLNQMLGCYTGSPTTPRPTNSPTPLPAGSTYAPTTGSPTTEMPTDAPTDAPTPQPTGSPTEAPTTDSTTDSVSGASATTVALMAPALLFFCHFF